MDVRQVLKVDRATVRDRKSTGLQRNTIELRVRTRLRDLHYFVQIENFRARDGWKYEENRAVLRALAPEANVELPRSQKRHKNRESSVNCIAHRNE
jgi:hypothetical protein